MKVHLRLFGIVLGQTNNVIQMYNSNAAPIGDPDLGGLHDVDLVIVDGGSLGNAAPSRRKR